MRDFDLHSFLEDLGEDLVRAFSRAGNNKTPSMVGHAREVSVRERLEQVLPVGIGVGSGFVIDSYGETSKQMDIVLFEKAFCPRFSYSEEATYYPCEGVIAVGEIKSTIGKEELKDIFEKIESAKLLKRFFQKDHQGFFVRDYGSNFELRSKILDSSKQIFTFALAGSFALRKETLCKHFLEHLNYLKSDRKFHLLPNLIVALNDGLITPFLDNKVEDGGGRTISFQDATHVLHFNTLNGNFRSLVSYLYHFYNNGSTAAITAIERYFPVFPTGIKRKDCSLYSIQ